MQQPLTLNLSVILTLFITLTITLIGIFFAGIFCLGILSHTMELDLGDYDVLVEVHVRRLVNVF